MDQYRSRPKLSENFERHWSIPISGEIHMDQSLVHTFFLGKFVWTNGPESSSKVSPYTGIGPWMALPRTSAEVGGRKTQSARQWPTHAPKLGLTSEYSEKASPALSNSTAANAHARVNRGVFAGHFLRLPFPQSDPNFPMAASTVQWHTSRHPVLRSVDPPRTSDSRSTGNNRTALHTEVTLDARSSWKFPSGRVFLELPRALPEFSCTLQNCPLCS